MKKSHFSDSRILSILHQAENGVPLPVLCREHGEQRQLSQMTCQIRRHGRIHDGSPERD